VAEIVLLAHNCLLAVEYKL